MSDDTEARRAVAETPPKLAAGDAAEGAAFLIAPELGDVWRCDRHGSPSCSICALETVNAQHKQGSSDENRGAKQGGSSPDALAVDWLDKHGMIEVSTGAPSQYTAGSLSALLADVRRETIEACAAWIEERARAGWRSVDVPAALRAQMAADSVGSATESQEKTR